MVNRAGLVPEATGGESAVSMVSRARDIMRRLNCLRPDLAAEDDRILTSLNQFDFLACHRAGCDKQLRAERCLLSHFAKFYGSRTQLIAERLIADQTLREQIYPGSDQQLAEALYQIDNAARKIGFAYDGWEGYTALVQEFVNANLPT
ncbi:hypothetical protein HC028_23330 [Planosporangium flavigriseum]|uniref:Uncharacterized protein n=1 Tax=Planosporangium flavigriseum TaxID=373681 RepID=A0A8J3LLM2_9ACTN|nr:hypothetical protein [Planosporangium flavigriseum]NJC67409.1 hypothetical protein [Planosporangium flavigriseum]GIG74952.1 hypothetical protein Pfl04_33560 [Planosporangium flavigriseum]